ncbi:DNA polymerase III subunit alpha [Patescibacteria group bacterium]|nr:DNA polymerase III subunit alpha [Patescibacteria group bacterium]
MPDFCHLHVHTENSLLDGYGSAVQYLAKAKELEFRYLACTDHGNQDGLIKFQKEAEKQGIKPILGCELYVVPDASSKKTGEFRHHITVLIKDDTGWQNLCKILTEANLHGFYYKPRTDFDTLKKYSKGLVFLSGCTASVMGTKIGYEFFSELRDLHPGDCYCEVMPHLFEDQAYINKICKNSGFDLVATNDVHYVNEDDADVHEVLLAIQTKVKRKDKNRFRFETKGLFLRSIQQMKEAFQVQGVLTKLEYLIAMRNTIEIAEKCSNFKIKRQDIFLPSILMKDEPEDEFLEKLCREGYNRIFTSLADLEDDPTYHSRFLEEFQMIKKKKFIGYFLVVWEITEWCKKNDIMIGPRGSVGGSLIAYLIGITSVDPIKYNLLFSRFIAEDRIDYPDIDVDFERVKRPLVRGHLEEMYGKNNIASVSTFMDMKGRAAIRDVARVFNIPYSEVDEFAKTIEDDENGENSIETASRTPEGQTFSRKYLNALKIAVRLEGQCRGVGQHAAALIVSADDLTQGTRCNLSTRSGQEVVNWDKDDAEYVGLMKLDVLGLSELSILNETRKLVEENHGKKIIFEKIELDNPQVFEMLSEGQTVGVFQFNTWTTTKLCKEIGIDNFGLMSDVIALVRPGPANSGMTADFTKRKHGGKWRKKHRIYEHITKDTYGIIIYQEQVMQVINQVAGLSYSTADAIRKIIAKKRDVKEFEKYRQMFIDGCKKEETLSEKEAAEFWTALEKHASYGFNRSHSVAYAMIAYWCAFCKLYFPAEFLCANLSYGTDGKKDDLVKEARRLGLSIVLPKVGISDAHLWVVKDNNLYVPFIEIKGVGPKVAEDLLKYHPPEPKAVVVQQKKEKPKQLGFFDIEEVEEPKTVLKEQKERKIDKILKAIGAIGNEPEQDLSKYFSFDVATDKHGEFPNLLSCLGFNFSPKDLDPILSLDVNQGFIRGKIHTTTKFQNPELLYCQECDLVKQCKHPVLPSPGRYNLAIVGEAPGCISGDSLIDVAFRDKSKFPNGIEIKDLVGQKDFYVYSFDVDNCKMVVDKVRKVWSTGIKKVWKVTYKWWKYTKGEDKESLINSLKVTKNHRFLLKKPTPSKHDPFKGINDGKRNYMSLDFGLGIGHSLQPFYRMSFDGRSFVRSADSEYEKESRVLAKFKSGEETIENYQVHHVDKNTSNDTWDNLELLTVQEHSSLHSKGDNNSMKNPEVKAKHLGIVKSAAYRSNMSKIMTEVRKNPFDRQKRLDNVEKYHEEKSQRSKEFFCDPFHYYGYLLARVNSEKFPNDDIEWAEGKFKNKFPNMEFPPIDNHKIISVEYVGEEEVYDIETEKYHNFAANGVFVHNSHEDEEGQGFVGRSGQLLWKELDKYGLIRRFFHMTNCVKCYPKDIRTPGDRHLNACAKWLNEEIIRADIRLALVFGNTGLKYFKNEDGGITKYNGKAEWLEAYSMWVVWCIHPSAVLRSPNNKNDFQKGIASFAEKINILGGLK